VKPAPFALTTWRLGKKDRGFWERRQHRTLENGFGNGFSCHEIDFEYVLFLLKIVVGT
jgi:hypothetical protein